MYTQLYFHPVRRIYDIHLKDFLKDWLPNGHFSTDLGKHLGLTDNEVLTAIRQISETPGVPGHDSARRIACREHFRPVYERNPIDQQRNPQSVERVENALKGKFNTASIRRDRYAQKSRGMSFPVFSRDGRIQNSLALSETLQKVPVFGVDLIFVDPEIREAARQWVEENRATIIPVAEQPKE
jgi:HD superfamily phosphohydrolase